MLFCFLPCHFNTIYFLFTCHFSYEKNVKSYAQIASLSCSCTHDYEALRAASVLLTHLAVFFTFQATETKALSSD